jgi:WD40 repeat protein
MREQARPEEIVASNERSLGTLSRAISLSQGHFALILVRCNYQVCSTQMWQRLQELTTAPMRELVLPKSLKTLFIDILAVLNDEQPSALVLFDLESVTDIDHVLVSTNQVRDEFRKHLTFPLVLWITDEVLQKLTRFAPDFKSWAATSIKFELPTNQLFALWHQTADDLFAAILGSDLGAFLPNNALDLAPGCRRRQELESALRDLYVRDLSLEPELRASWQLILGRDAFDHDQIALALEQYQQSLGFWQQELKRGKNSSTEQIAHRLTQPNPKSKLQNPKTLERIGVLFHHISLCYCRQAELQPAERCRQWEQARESIQSAIDMFAVAGRLDIVAQLTIQMGEVFRYLQNWTDLQALALQALALPQIQNNPVQLAQAYGFLALVALVESMWEDAKALATSALDILEPSQSSEPQQLSVVAQALASVVLTEQCLEKRLPPAPSKERSQSNNEVVLQGVDHYRAFFLLIVAKAQRQLGEPIAAVISLEQAINVEKSPPNSLQRHLQLYIDILQELRSLYLEQQQYLRAFELKQEQRLIEQQNGLCPFLGATSLQPRRQGSRLSPPEIAAAGRQLDVNRLIERLSRNDHKLTIIHGSSGVGKSSLINAGLVPALESRIIGTRATMPVVQKVYRDWVGELGRLLTQELNSWQVSRVESSTESSQASSLPYPFGKANVYDVPTFTPSDIPTILEQLQLSYERNLLTVLIFDQFEEFFFACTDLAQRRQFYDFLAQCLNLPFVKVILSLREDYLHYLLECEHYCNLNAINNNILERQLRYPLGDISPEDTKNVIRTLAKVSQFQLEDSLIEALVQDLAERSGGVRLIELQVVGAQLQAEKITTTAQYYALGADPKAVLVERSLFNVISDCGSENEDTVWQVLFALTDERGIRPLKTLPQLLTSQWSTVSNVSAQWKTDTLDLILKILVGSGLVFRIPEALQDRYQLVHDYLVEPIRHNYHQRNQSRFLAQLRSSEIELLRVRKQRQRAIAIGVAMTVLGVSAGGLGWRAEVQRRLAGTLLINAQLSALVASSEALFLSNKQFDALIEALRAARRLKKLETESPSSPQVEPDTQLQVVTALSQAVYSTAERNRLEGHSDAISHISFSPNGQLIASASDDQTVKLWNPNGSLVTTLRGHQGSVTHVAFSPDSKLIASASWDGMVKLWRRNGKVVKTLRGHLGNVYSVSFSPNGEQIASVGIDRTIRLWTVGGKLIRTFQGHTDAVQSVSFSPDGEMIASAGADQTIRLWTPKGTLLQTLKGHKGKVNCVVFSPDGQKIASASDDKTVKIWSRSGKLLKTFAKHEKWVLGVAFSADGQLLASASDDNTVKLWGQDGTLLKTFLGHSDRVTAVSFNPTVLSRQEGQGGRLFTTSPPQPLLASASLDKTIKLWGRRNPSRLILRGHQDDVEEVTFSPNGELIATASKDKTVKIWTRTGKLLNTLKGHTDSVDSVGFSPDGQLIVSASRDKTVKLWNRRGGLIKTLTGHNDWVLDVSFSPDGEQLVSTSRDGTVKLWNRDGTLIKTLESHRGDEEEATALRPNGSRKPFLRWSRYGSKLIVAKPINSVSFSADAQRIASANDDNSVKLWLADGRLLKTLHGHNGWVLDVNFSPDSQILASASYDNTIKLWNRDGKLLKTLKGHTDSVAKVRFSPRGQILATTSWSNEIQLWRLDDTLIETLEGHKERVTSISWSNDGKSLASASEDDTVIVWNLELDDLLYKSCSWLRDYLENNPNVRESDRYLCEPPLDPKPTENDKN